MYIPHGFRGYHCSRWYHLGPTIRFFILIMRLSRSVHRCAEVYEHNCLFIVLFARRWPHSHRRISTVVAQVTRIHAITKSCKYEITSICVSEPVRSQSIQRSSRMSIRYRIQWVLTFTIHCSSVVSSTPFVLRYRIKSHPHARLRYAVCCDNMDL